MSAGGRWAAHVRGTVLATVCAAGAAGWAPAHAARLDGVRAVAVSPDGAYVYAAAEFADAIVVFHRAAATGALTPVQTVRHSAAGPLLDAVDSVALSPDGRHLYAAAFVSSAVNVFARDPATGRLSFVGAQVDDVGGVDGLRSAHGAIVSPDGSHVYVAGYEDDAIAVFARDASTGALSFVEAQRDGVGGVDGLDAVPWVALSPDGAHLYAAGALDGAVAVFARNPSSGALTFLQVLRNGTDGVLGLDGARVTLVSPDGLHVYVASGAILVAPSDNAVVVFARDPASGLLTFLHAYPDGVDGVSGLFGVYQIAFAAGGASLYGASFGANAITAFDRDTASGALAFRQVVHDGAALLGGAHALAVSPDDAQVYVAAFNEPALTWFERDALTGALSYAGSIGSTPGLLDLCPAAPPPDCHQAERATLKLGAGRRRTLLTYRWRHGAATTAAELGDPLRGETHYALCIYDAPGGIPAFRTGAFAPPDQLCAVGPGLCWQSARRGLVYDDAARIPEALGSLALHPDVTGQARIRARGVGNDLPAGAPPLALPVTAVVRNSDGACWSTTFAPEDVRESDGDPDRPLRFAARQ